MRTTPAVIFALLFIVAGGYFGAHWFLLPGSLSKVEARWTLASARYLPGRAKQVAFIESDGRTSVVSCGRVRELCEELKQSDIKALAVWLAEPVLGEEPWVAAVEYKGRDIVQGWQQSVRYGKFRVVLLGLALAFISMAIAVLALQRWLDRGSEQHAA